MANFYNANQEAKAIRKKYAGETGPINVMQIIEGEELEIAFCEDCSDAYIADETIYISNEASIPVERHIFSIAHELGHWFLHDRSVSHDRNTMDYDHNFSNEEREANAFAAELLMPFEEMKTKIRNRWTASDLADYYKVSLEFARYRVENVKKAMF